MSEFEGSITVGEGVPVTTVCGEPRPWEKGPEWILCALEPGHPGLHGWEREVNREHSRD